MRQESVECQYNKKIKVIAFVWELLQLHAGSLQAEFVGSVVPKTIPLLATINVLIIVVFGGLGSMTGAIVAAVVVINMLYKVSQAFG